MTSRECVTKTIPFEGADRLPFKFPEKYGSDFTDVRVDPSPDARPNNQKDEWCAKWENIGVSNLGEVKDFPLKNWTKFDTLNIPQIDDPKRWNALDGARESAGHRLEAIDAMCQEFLDISREHKSV